MKIYFLGGSFDPPHIGHLEIAKKCLRYCDKFIFIPSKQAPHKQDRPYFSSKDRIEMLKLLIRKEKNIEIDSFELKSEKEISYSIDTIRYLNKKYPNSKIYMVLGSDLIKNLISWKNWDEIKQNVRLVCVERDGYVIKNKSQNIKYIADVNLEVSSSYIRKIIFSKNKNNYLDMSKYITRDIYGYIFKKAKVSSC